MLILALYQSVNTSHGRTVDDIASGSLTFFTLDIEQGLSRTRGKSRGRKWLKFSADILVAAWRRRPAAFSSFFAFALSEHTSLW